MRSTGIAIVASTAISLLVGLNAVAWAADCTEPAGVGVDWQRCFLDRRELSGQSLIGAKLTDASFERAVLTKSDLTKVIAYHSKFISASMAGAKLDDGNFAEADFTKADLTGASLKNADLRRARFYHSILRHADFTGAKTLGADMLNADLSGATWTDGKRICAEGSIGQCN